MSKPSKELSEVRARAGALGGKTVTPKKIAHLASIASKGGKTVTEKRRKHLASIAAKGGKAVTEKKREHLRKALAVRWAKVRNKPT
jgi:ribosomal protein L34